MGDFPARRFLRFSLIPRSGNPEASALCRKVRTRHCRLGGFSKCRCRRRTSAWRRDSGSQPQARPQHRGVPSGSRRRSGPVGSPARQPRRIDALYRRRIPVAQTTKKEGRSSSGVCTRLAGLSCFDQGPPAAARIHSHFYILRCISPRLPLRFDGVSDSWKCPGHGHFWQFGKFRETATPRRSSCDLDRFWRWHCYWHCCG